jgi:DNA polymerase-4
VEYHQRILEELDRHYPVHRVESIDEMSFELDVERCELARAIDLAEQMRRGLRERVGECLRCSIGLAPNAFLAKVATDMEKPDGLVVIKRSELPGRLLELELQDLPGIGRQMLPRLQLGGIQSMEDLWQAPAGVLRKIWGGVMGTRFWYHLHGYTLASEETRRSSVGHSQMLAPAMRKPEQALLVVQRLLQKAASRLRRLGYECQLAQLNIRTERHFRGEWQKRFSPVSDTHYLVRMLYEMWEEALPYLDRQRILKASITLMGLVNQEQAAQGDFLDQLFPAKLEVPKEKRDQVSRCMDEINQRYGKDRVCLGLAPSYIHSYTGTKIAFNRIPDLTEFKE